MEDTMSQTMLTNLKCTTATVISSTAMPNRLILKRNINSK